MINKYDYQELEKINLKKRDWVNFIEKPIKTGQTVTDFKQWVFEESVGKYKKLENKIKYPYSGISEKKIKKDFEDSEKIRENIESFFQTQWLENSTNGIFKNSSDWSPFIVRKKLRENKYFESSKLFINKCPLRMKPEVIFQNKLNKNKYIIVKRSITKIDSTKYRKNNYHRSLQLQLWCYSWMNELIDADSVSLFVQFYKNNDYGDPVRLSGDALMWERGDNNHEEFCKKIFKLYGGTYMNNN